MARDLIDTLAEDLTPVRPLGIAAPAIIVGGLTLVSGFCVLAILGPRSAFGAGFDTPMFLIRGGILLLLGIAGLAALAAMTSPRVGRAVTGWRWAAGVAAILPAIALVLAATATDTLADRVVPTDGLECLRWSIGIGAIIAGALTIRARRGAPASPERAGTVIGMAAGGFGALAYSLHCPHDDLIYIGLWYTLAVGAVMLACRLILPRFLRW